MINISICIPYVNENIDNIYIKNVFKRYKFGNLKRVDLIKIKNKNYKRAFIHFNYWYDNDVSNYVQNELSKGNDIKIIHDKPWFWKCYINVSKKLSFIQ
jgi:hypothetical protein